MVKRAKPRLNPDETYAPNGAAAKTGLNKEVHDAAWAMIRRMTLYKAENAGIEVILVNPAYTSQMCYECKFVDSGNRNGEAFKCLACGHRDHADTNAAKNILWLGLSLRENCLQAV
jgi:putative transposase